MAEDMSLSPEVTKALGEIRSLIIQLDLARQEASRERHKSIGDTLQRLLNDQAAIRGDMRSAAHEFDAVESRVTVIEESQKRVMWIAIAIMPSAIAAWEGVKKFFGAHA